MLLLFGKTASGDRQGKECNGRQSKSVKGETEETFGPLHMKSNVERDVVTGWEM